MAETWTDCDETKWLELDRRRARVLESRRGRLLEAVKHAPGYEGKTLLPLLEYLEANAVSVVAALEPYTLHGQMLVEEPHE